MTETKPRPHQKRAIKDILNTLDGGSRAQLIMACASGKTLTGAWIGEELDAQRIVIFVPSVALITQSYEAYSQALNGAWHAMGVCHDDTVERQDARIPFPVSNDPERIRQFMRKRGRRVLFCTYQSADVLMGMTFDYGVFDEAHKTAGFEDKFFSLGLYNDNITIKKRLFMTATPRKSRLRGSHGVEIVSMDNADVYGEVGHSLSFRKAVEQGIICEYRVLITVLNKPVDTSKNSATQVAIAQAVEKYGIKSIFSYHHTVVEAQEFLHNMDKVLPDATLLHVNGKQTWKQRSKIMRKFEEADLGFMTNARCLVEGVDVPSVDMTAFTHPKKSVVDIVQAVGRSMRKDPDNPKKKYGYILVPVFLQEGMDLDDALKEAQFDHVFDVVNAMRDQDEALEAAIRTDILKLEELGELPNIELENLTGYDIKRLKSAISVKIATRLVTSIEIKKAKLRSWAKSGKPRPNGRSDNLEEKQLGRALTNYAGRKASPQFDPEFRKEMELLRPEWFMKSKRKAELIRRLTNGGQKPDWQKERKLAEMFHNFIKPGSKVYDEEFVELVKERRPAWLVKLQDQARNTKLELMRRAREGENRPTARKTASQQEKSFYKAFSRYTNPSQDSYDEEFHMELFVMRPDWFSYRPNYDEVYPKAAKWARARRLKMGYADPARDRSWRWRRKPEK